MEHASNNSVTSTTSSTTQAQKPVGRSSFSKSKSRPSLPPTNRVDQVNVDQLLLWLDGLPLSRSRSELGLGRLERDFADGYLVAEAIAQHHPKIVEMHNYTRGSSAVVKRHNWHHLRRKVLCKLNLDVCDEHIESIIEAKPGAVNKVLKSIHDIATKLEAQKREAEEERARASADPLPLDSWKEGTCFVRKDPKGQKEFMIEGKLMAVKDFMVQEIETRDLRLEEYMVANEQLKSQVARLQMIVDLKEDRLAELTHKLSLAQRQDQQKLSTPPGPDGDARKVSRNSFPKI